MLPDSQISHKVHHQNICSLKYKTNELLSFLYPHYPHIICLTEHHLKQFELHNISTDNYNPVASYCRKSSLKGGICIYVLKTLSFTTVNLKAYCSDHDTEICAVKSNSTFSNICVFSIYRTPTANFTHILCKVNIILNSLYNSTIEFIICGDVNINYLTDTHRKNKLNSKYGLEGQMQ
jgi:exonuclease III